MLINVKKRKDDAFQRTMFDSGKHNDSGCTITHKSTGPILLR